MAKILWTTWQQQHIAAADRHHPRVRREDVEEAWHDPNRQDVRQGYDDVHGPYTVSYGAARDRALLMLWRFQDGSDDVWMVTAYFPKPKGRKARKRSR